MYMNLIPSRFYLDDFTIPKKDINMKCDIYEENNNYYIEMDVPGFTKEDIFIEVDDDYLIVTASKNAVESDDNKKYIRRERVYGKYERRIYLGKLDQDKIIAEFNNGILKITVPKKEEINNKKVIDII